MSAPSSSSEEPPFSLELVAVVAATLMAQRANGSASAAAREQAADEAVRLLEACQHRLERNLQIRKSERPPPNEHEIAKREREREIKEVEARFGSPVPFSVGFRYITDQPTETKAVGWYRSWRKHVLSRSSLPTKGRSEKPNFPDDPVRERITTELKFRHGEGFLPRRLVALKEEFIKWKHDYPGQGPGKKNV